MTFIIRRARADDVQAIRLIAEKAYQPYIIRLGKKPAPMVADFEKHVAEDWVIVFERDVVLGYAILLVNPASALLDNLAVDASTQRQGMGRALIDHVERHLIELGRTSYDLYTNAAMAENILWYCRLGFVETERIEEKGFNRVYMRKSLVSTS